MIPALHTRHAWRITSVLLAVALALAPRSARAQASPADRAIAEALFREGQAMLAEGRTDEACAKLGESQRIDPTLGTLLNLATCHEQQGKLATAWAEFTAAISLASHAKRADRVKFAREHADALAPRLAHLTLRLATSKTEVTLKLDGRSLGVAAVGTRMPVDPGQHRVEASAPGKAPWSTAVEVGPSADASVEIPPLQDAPAAMTAPETSVPLAPAPHAAPGPSSTRRTAGLVVGAAGLAAVGVGSVFGVLTLSTESDANKSCPGVVCPDRPSYDLHQRAGTFATVSTIAFGVGLAGVAAGTALFVTAPGGASSTTPAERRRRAFARLGVSGGPGGVRAFGDF